jgi:hypothetical protein
MSGILKIFIILLIMALPVGAYACAPCEQILSLKETIKKADLVILAESKIYDFKSDGTPEKINADVLRVLKGNYTDKSIELNSWTGEMCEFGFVFRKPQQVLIISTNQHGQYERVANGCDTNSLPYENGLVGGKESLDDFIKNHIETQ